MLNLNATRLWCALIFIAFVCADVPARAASVIFDIGYIDEIQQTKPTVASFSENQHLTVTLHDGHRVTEQREWRTPSQSGTVGKSSALGEKAAATDGHPIKWKVEGRNSLIRYRELPQHIEVVKIVVSGKNCEATISYVLKRGFSEYERFGSDGKPGFFGSLRASSITCSVQGG